MNACPHCQAREKQIKIGFNMSGSQRYRCQGCGRKYTPEPKEHGYPDEVRQQAVRWYMDGMNFRRIACHLGVHHQTVINWINAHVASLRDLPPLSDEVGVVEQDELFTFVGSKKRGLHHDHSGAFDALHYCLVGW
jgi:transposase-like protein